MRTNLIGIFLGFCVFATSVVGQKINREEIEEQGLSNLEETPSTRLLDLGEVFAGQESERQFLTERLDALATRHGFSVYFVAYSGIIGSDVVEKAELFRDNWLGSKEEGLILVCDTDMKSMAYALTKANSLSASEPNHAWKLPDHEAIAVIKTMSKVSPEGLSEKDYLNLMGHSLVDELEKRFTSQGQESKKRSSGLLLAFALTASLVSAGLWWGQKRSSSGSQLQGASFPNISIPQRLGAPFGGGQVGEISFKVPPSGDSP